MENLILYLIPVVLMGFGQMWVQSAYSKYAKIANDSGITGAEAAKRILEYNDIYDVEVRQGNGKLSDHYNPKDKLINLSPEVFAGHSIASIAIAAHEVGHAIQHHVGYQILVFRNTVLPFAQIGSTLGWSALMFGIFGDVTGLIYVGLIAVGAIALFQFVTLPVELNASKRAKEQLIATNIASGNEIAGANKVLTAAAFTYIAAFLATVFQVVRLLMLRSRRD